MLLRATTRLAGNAVAVMTDPLHGWRQRRREAARRLRPLDCPGRCRDPLFDCRGRCEPPPPPVTEVMVDAAVKTARHLFELGCPPMFDSDTLSAMHARGGADGRLAQELYDLAGGDA